MNLAETQAAFMAQVLDEDAPPVEGFEERHAAGLSIYRNNYRSALVEALRSTYERTVRWVGEDAFRRAAAHHLIMHPPVSWTIDEAGARFDETCVQLFSKDPEVGELAWLEWTMLEVFTRENIEPLDTAEFGAATTQFSDEDWAGLRLQFLPGAKARVVGHDLRMLWNALDQDGFERPDLPVSEQRGIIVWREGERPTFLMVDAEEARAFEQLRQGVPYGELCVALAGDGPSAESMQQAAMRAGAMLGRWLNEGIVAEFRLG